MQEFIEELKNNQKINFEKGLENRVNIDYVIERLESINILREYIKNEIDFNIETYVNDEFNDYQDKELLYNMKDDDLNLMIDKILDSKYPMDTINETLNDAIYDELNTYLEEIRNKD